MYVLTFHSYGLYNIFLSSKTQSNYASSCHEAGYRARVQSAIIYRRAEAGVLPLLVRSKRSRSMTLAQAATKSLLNLASPSVLP